MLPATNPSMIAVLLPREVLELDDVSAGNDGGGLLELSIVSSTLIESISRHKIKFNVI